MKQETKERILNFNKKARELESQGYRLNGTSVGSTKNILTKGEYPFCEVVGYLDIKTLEVILY